MLELPSGRLIHPRPVSMFDLNQLRCFVTVAEELHFGRAAARLNMTQPPLSRQIQVLEHIIDAVLLERTSRSVRLVPPALGDQPMWNGRTTTRDGSACSLRL